MLPAWRRESDDSRDHRERVSTEVVIEAGTEYILATIPELDEQPNERGICELSFVDPDSTCLRINERIEVIDAHEFRGWFLFSVPATTHSTVTSVGVRVKELERLTTVSPPMAEVFDESIALLGEHRPEVDFDFSDGGKRAQCHEMSPGDRYILDDQMTIKISHRG